MKSIFRVSCLSLLLILSIPVLDGCRAKRVVAPDATATPITTWEQINFDNVQISIHARAGAKATVAARQTGFLTVAQFDQLRKGEIKILRAHKQLTPYLKDLQTALANKEKIRPLVTLISDTANDLVSSGVVGISNPQSQTAIKAEIVAVQSLGNSLADLLKASGVLK